MALNALGMGFVFTARDLATGVFQRLQSNISQLSAKSKAAAVAYKKHMAQIKSGALMAGAGMVTLGLMNKASKAYGEFEYTLVSAGVVMRATTEEMVQLKDAAIQAGIKTQFSPKEATEGLQALGAAGLNAKTSIQVLNPVLDLAASSLGQLNVQMASENVVGSLNAFGMTADKAGIVVDKLTRITQMSNFQARDFGVAISQAAAQAKSADQSYSSMLATLGLLRNTNLDASSAATAYREAARRVSGDKRAQKMLAKLHVDALDKETGKIKDLAQVIAEMQPALAKLNAKERNLYLTKIFGVRGQKTYNAVMMGYNKLLAEGKVKAGDYAAAHRLLVEGLDNSAGAAAKTREELLKTAKGQRILLQGSWETFQVMAGETLTPFLLPALKSITWILNKLIKGFKAIPGPIKVFMSYAIGTGAALMTLVGAFKILRGVMGLLTLGRVAGQYVSGLITASAATKKLTGDTVRLTLAERARAMGGGMLRGAGRFLAAAAGPVMIGVSIISGLLAYENAKQEERRKKEQARQAMLKQTIQLYDKQKEAIDRVAASAGRALVGEMKLAKQGYGKALEVLDKVQGRLGPLRAKMEAAWKAYQRAVADKKSQKEQVKALGVFSKIAARYRVEEMHRLDVQALVAKKRYADARASKDTAAMQVFASQMIAGRVAKQLAGETKLAQWKASREKYFVALKQKNIGQWKQEYPLFQKVLEARKRDLRSYQHGTALRARRLGLDNRITKLSGPKQREKLLSLTKAYRSEESKIALQTARQAAISGKIQAQRERNRGVGAQEGTLGGFVRDVGKTIWQNPKNWFSGGKSVPLAPMLSNVTSLIARNVPGGSKPPEPDRTLAGQMRAMQDTMAANVMGDPYSQQMLGGATDTTINLFVDSEKIATVVDKRGRMKNRQGDQAAGRVRRTARRAGRSR